MTTATGEQPVDLRTVAAPPWTDDLVAVAHHGGLVDVWSLARAERLGSLETLWDGGGWRGAVVLGDRPLVVAGAWERHGVCGYDLSGERLWQDRSRTNVHTVTALAGGRVVVTHSRRATRVLEAATGEELRTLRGVLRLVPLTSDLSLGAGGGWCRLLDGDLDPVGPRIPTGLNTVWSAATDGELLVVQELAGPCRVLDGDGRDRATVPGSFRALAHEPRTGTWVGLGSTTHEREALVRFDEDGTVVDQRPLDPLRDGAFVRGGRSLVSVTDDGVQVVDCSDGTVEELTDGRRGGSAART